MCCCIFFPILNTRNMFLLLLHFHVLSSCFPTLLSCFSPSFPPPPHLLFPSLYLSLPHPPRPFLLSGPVLDIGAVNSLHFPLSHSGLFICHMHVGVAHLVRHHCAPALVVFRGVAFSLRHLKTNELFPRQMCLCYD